MKQQIMLCLIVGMFVSGCSASPSLEGVWSADDGTGTKTFQADGSCTGMYYNEGQPLDIGGRATCTLGEKSSDGTFTLVVEQPPNKANYDLTFDGSDTVRIDTGTTTVLLKRL